MCRKIYEKIKSNKIRESFDSNEPKSPIKFDRKELMISDNIIEYLDL